MKQTLLIAFALGVFPTLYSQQDVGASGGDFSGSGGSVSFSTGIAVYTTITGDGGTASFLCRIIRTPHYKHDLQFWFFGTRPKFFCLSLCELT